MTNINETKTKKATNMFQRVRNLTADNMQNSSQIDTSEHLLYEPLSRPALGVQTHQFRVEESKTIPN